MPKGRDMDHSQYLDLDPVKLPEGTIFRLPAGRCLIAQPSMFDDSTWIVLEYAIGEAPHALTRGGFMGQDAAESYAHVAHALRTVELGWTA